MRHFFTLLVLLISGSTMAQPLMSPADFLSLDYGKSFIPYHLKVAYFEYVASHSDLVILHTYGHTEEMRPQIQAYVSAKENLDRLGEIRLNNLRRTGLAEGSPVDDGIAIIMLAYSVHGNEAAGSEAALTTLFQLADPSNQTTKPWLKNTVVIIDLSLNPDGHARYVDWYARVANRITDIDPDGWEHREPWPGGRTNHYFFDLNRDWAWQTQKETRARIRQYLSWMPHIHVDLHEMNVNSPYYFAPAAQPYHEYITPWQRDFQSVIGQNNARYFDRHGWLYFTREVFDLLYPAYGDTYPTYSGAIGMTYEQGGSGRAGVAVRLENEDTLTLQDRIDHHVTASLSSIEMASVHAHELTRHFGEFYAATRSRGRGQYQSYLISHENNREKLKAIRNLLDLNAIRYFSSTAQQRISGFDYVTGEEKTITVHSGDLIVSAIQPRSTLVQVLLDPEPLLVDSLTYDITSWSLPHVFGVKALATEVIIKADQTYELPAREEELTDSPYAFFIPWLHTNSARLLSDFFKAGIRVRKAGETIVNYGRTYLPGTLIITRSDNDHLTGWEDLVTSLAKEWDHSVYATPTGLSGSGPDLGSDKVRLIAPPKILLLGDEGVGSNDFGHTWYYFEKCLEYPLTICRVDEFNQADLNKYNTLIMPNGHYPQLGESHMRKISDWVNAGGKLICTGNAMRRLKGQAGFALTEYTTDSDKEEAEKARKDVEKERAFKIYEERTRTSISDDVPGAIVKNKLDSSHPLAYGFPDYYFSLKTLNAIYQVQKDAWNVGWVEKDPQVLGFIGNNVRRKLEGSVSFAVEDKGRGKVIYMVDDPLFRGFWENGKFLFSNAVFMVDN